MTVPPQSSVTWPEEVIIPWENVGDGQLTFTEGTGVSINPPVGFEPNARAKGSMGSLIRNSENVWRLTGDLEVTPDTEAAELKFKDYSLTIKAHGNLSANTNMAHSDGNMHTLTVTANIALTASAWPPSGALGQITVQVKQDSVGSWLITDWPVDKWMGGSVPILETAANAVNEVVITTDDAGTVKIGRHVGSWV